jgi:hypothetical protein
MVSGARRRAKILLAPLTIAGGAQSQWKSAHIIAPLVVSAFCVPVIQHPKKFNYKVSWAESLKRGAEFLQGALLFDPPPHGLAATLPMLSFPLPTGTGVSGCGASFILFLRFLS